MFNLASNFNNLGTPEGLLNYLKSDLVSLLSAYSGDNFGKIDMSSTENLLNIEPDTMCICSGSTHALQISTDIFDYNNVFVLKPTFWEYSYFNKRFIDRSIHRIEATNLNILKNIREALKNYTSGAFYLCNPNNPTGQTIDKQSVLRLISDFPNIIFIIDETYLWFNEHFFELTLMNDSSKFNNCVVITSLSKIFTVPGIRLGIVVSNNKIINEFQNHIAPYAIGNIQIKSIEYLLEHEKDFLLKSQINNSKNISRITKLLDGLNIKYLPTVTNFVFIEDSNGRIFDKLKKDKIIVRNGSEFGEEYAKYLRIKLWEQDMDNIMYSVFKN